MYAFLGHPLVDVGIAALTALAHRPSPDALTEADLMQISAYLAHWYTTETGGVRNFVKGSVFHNANYGVPNADLQRQHIARTLDAWRTPGTRSEPCAFCGQPAAYRASRRDIPMLNGQTFYNFGARGTAGVPVCGLCSLALQALPFGCMRSGKYLIACHSDHPALLLALTRMAVRRAEQALTLDGALPIFRADKTRFVALLIDGLAALERESTLGALTGYLFTNAGASADIRIYMLNAEVIGFVERALHNADGSLSDAWTWAVARAWGRGKTDDADTMQRPNRLYEALLDLPHDGYAFLRKHLLPTRHWGVVALFLRKVMHMEPDRIALLKGLGVRFAAYTLTRRRFFYPFAREMQYAKWRRHVLNAADDQRRQAGAPLITFDEFVAAFTAPPGEINDWRLMRDLVLLAMLDAGTQSDTPLFDDTDTDTPEMAEQDDMDTKTDMETETDQ